MTKPTPIALLTALLLGAPASAQDLREAEDRFIQGSAAAESALQQALATASPEVRAALERALGEVRDARGRTIRELSQARGEPGETGRARALAAVERGTQVHLGVLERVRERVPEQARPAIDRALDVSRRGGETAPGAVGTGGPGVRFGRPEVPPAGIGGPPPGIPAGPPAGIRTGPPAGIPAGRPAGIPGGPSGVRGGPPVGRPGR